MKAKNLLFMLAIGVLAASCNAGGSFNQTSTTLKTPTDSASFYLGYLNGSQFLQMKFKDVNVEALVAGLNSALQKKEVGTDPQMMNMFLNQYFQNLSMKLAQENLEKGNKFLEENAKKEGVQTLVDGIQYKVITKGEGAQPKATDMVKVHYKGTLIDGTEFDSSYKRGEPAEFPLNGVIQGWTKALQAMPVGSKWIIYLPAKEAYGQRGGGPIGPNETLIFEVELLEITTPAADQK